MQKRKMTAGAAATGVLAGTAGLFWLAMPAGADQAPSLPEISPEALVESMLTAETPAFAGTVALENNLGLPSVGGLAGGAMDGLESLSGTQAQIASDGGERFRMIMGTGRGTTTTVHDGETLWEWNADQQTVVKSSMTSESSEGMAGVPDPEGHQVVPEDPTAVARSAVEQLREISSVTVDGTASVAGRDAYELALAPSPEERTLLREVRVAVDSETRVPLRVTVLGNGSDDSVLELGFTDVEFGEQDPEDFTFQPPEGATVQDLDELEPHSDDPAELDAVEESDPAATDPADTGAATEWEVFGDGWDSVLVFQLDQAEGAAGQDIDFEQLPEGLSEPVSGEWGEGQLFSTAVITAIVTDDGRIAAGAVPAQVLTEALEETR
ncbi:MULTISPECIES: LolA family protein [Actinoalloteichus]|uniref:MucB/RseB N-terminal domain-containing protein n=1 Tax=Actinoalloteichus fjordicus TaxID=1612552 RepID=A0AAC9LAA8_9PSEU|nr:MULTISPECIES: hypothetical protein [Actinoalloteichus]APU12947.1 hypothetical protein UA74_04340 [Actinoalloteichus fjordicus]APU18918.1 hypothetical protein UA75_04445 [Actinoalloteichus sp. GBA129-24]